MVSADQYKKQNCFAIPQIYSGDLQFTRRNSNLLETGMDMNRRQFMATSALAAAAPIAASAPLASGIKQTAAPDFKLCVFSKHLQFLDYPEMAETAAEIGFDGVDLPVRPRGHVLPEKAKSDLPAAVKAVNAAGLKAYMMTTAINSVTSPHAETILRLADEHDIRVYRMGYLSYDKNLSVAGSLKKLQPEMTVLAELNEKYGIQGGYQNHSGTRIGGPVWDIWEMLRQTDSRWIGCQYDIRHAVVEGGTAWPVVLKLLYPRINSLVMKDFYWAKEDGKWRIRNCPLGEGMVDWPKFLTMVKELGIGGPISMHFEYHIHGESESVSEKTEKCINAMRKDVQTARKLLADAGLN
jgi:sugar phosphate isomerase/epimerase